MSAVEPTSVGSRFARTAAIVLGAPGWLVGLALSQWLLAKLAAMPVVAAVTAATEGHAPGSRPEAYERLLAVVAELFVTSPSVAAVAVAMLAVTTVVSTIGWTVLSTAVLARYVAAWRGASVSRDAVASAWARALPGVVVQSLWHWALRAALLWAALLATAELPDEIGWAVTGITLCISIVALDVARAAVVGGIGGTLHPRTAARAFMVALRTPALLLPAAVMAAVGLVVTAGTLWAAIQALWDPSWLWGARALNLAGLVVGLLRLAWVAEHPAVAGVAQPPKPDDDPPEEGSD